MLALVLEEPAPASEAPLLLRDLGRPEPGPDEILLRVAACGVCRTPRAAFAAPTCR
jgi:D-arabinose 1-dehydrogenase-like Zn-dependent alcohol dehydrogenase